MVLFPEANWPTREEVEVFISRLDPIDDQMQSLGINHYHRPYVLFFIITGPKRAVRKYSWPSSMSLEEMIDDVEKKIIFDGVLRTRRVSRWTSVTFDQFRISKYCEERAIRKGLELVTEYQCAITKHLIPQKTLYNRIRAIFVDLEIFEAVTSFSSTLCPKHW